MLILGEVLQKHGISQAKLAAETHLSTATISLLIRHNTYPRSMRRRDLRSIVCAVLTRMQVPVDEMVDLFLEAEERKEAGKERQISAAGKSPRREQETATRTNASPSGETQSREGCNEMLLRKQTLSEAARRKFGIFRDPFDDPQQSSEVYLSPAIRQVREAIWQVALGNIKFLAVIGESGAGKSTLREEMEERLRLEARPVRLIQPYVLAMEDSDRQGKCLRSEHIAEAMLHAVASGESPKRSPEARFRQVHEALIASSRVGMQHVLIIEEAHGLPIPTLKHLKRFLELKDGMRRLVSVLLLGQPELRDKLDERRAAVREVAQRCQIVGLPPLDSHLGDYLAHRFSAVGLELSAIVEPEAIGALLLALSIRQRTGAGPAEVAVISLTHPLVANNLLTAAINQAAALGAPRVTADLVRAVREAMP
ncbi:MAG TPA: AAA family ATPase [Accumulibacter sp.]|uniref:ExeA family protein n=1 Tax=Accumulibacter sp. TaxID=2053492 RepID=UPI0025EA3D0B|nr:AAA family ATPase [Accumulibacter sp.]MCM8599931.1 AAA family ATPase [Accumulibacter sp.]MCM8664115.1 AAA family ATPase [Accumulibacter sp.]HNC51229.1 AAA family ATPase [Accumulibacter sp.]